MSPVRFEWRIHQGMERPGEVTQIELIEWPGDEGRVGNY
jgi:hypothetical protein